MTDLNGLIDEDDGEICFSCSWEHDTEIEYCEQGEHCDLCCTCDEE